jgi:hypothetical protein
MRIILIAALFLLPISAAAAADLNRLPPRYAISDANLDRCAAQRTPWFWPTRADLAFARRLCAYEGWPARQPYFDLPW